MGTERLEIRSHPGSDLRESILEMSDAYLKVWGMKGEKKLFVISIEMVI